MNTVQSIGSFSMTISHPLVNGGVLQTIRGIKLDGAFLDTAPEMENSKRIALIGGGAGSIDTAALTNNAQFGDMTINVIRVDGVVSKDLIIYCLAWQAVADSTGASINVSYNINGKTDFWGFPAVTLGKVPPLKLAGNDLPEYAVVLKYPSYSYSYA
jgi:hypothetical protein